MGDPFSPRRKHNHLIFGLPQPVSKTTQAAVKPHPDLKKAYTNTYNTSQHEPFLVAKSNQSRNLDLKGLAWLTRSDKIRVSLACHTQPVPSRCPVLLSCLWNCRRWNRLALSFGLGFWRFLSQSGWRRNYLYMYLYIYLLYNIIYISLEVLGCQTNLLFGILNFNIYVLARN